MLSVSCEIYALINDMIFDHHHEIFEPLPIEGTSSYSQILNQIKSCISSFTLNLSKDFFARWGTSNLNGILFR